MRLKTHEIESIKRVLMSADEAAEIYIFGSRVDDSKRGGDIDILMLSENCAQAESYKLVGRICEYIGEQRIDLLIEKDKQAPFTKLIYQGAVRIS